MSAKTGKRYDEDYKKTLDERLKIVHKLRFQHNIKTLCRALRINRSTYYKHFNTTPAPRTKENLDIKRIILQIYSDYDKCHGAYKITYILSRDYGINIRNKGLAVITYISSSIKRLRF